MNTQQTLQLKAERADSGTIHLYGETLESVAYLKRHDNDLERAIEIVQAVNSHHALVEACQSMLEWMEFTIPRLHTTPSGSIERMNYGGPVNKARAALAKAGGAAL